MQNYILVTKGTICAMIYLRDRNNIFLKGQKKRKFKVNLSLSNVFHLS